jgi:NAD(P)-dependent dehydrogenase (short-subunit alcohol dehydrogenase family)
VNITIIDLDLSSLNSVKSGAAHFNREATRLDILLLNAGVAAVPPALTKDGYETHFGTNHMGHALLTQLLMPTLLHTARLPGSDVRVVVLSSVGHTGFSQKSFNFSDVKTDMRGTSAMTLYAQSKLANILFAKSLAQYYPQLTIASVHPGTVKTDIWKKADGHPILRRLVRPVIMMTGVTVEEGAKNQLWCCTSGDVQSGTYYEPIGKAEQESSQARDDALAEKLWTWTEEELKIYGGPGWVKHEDI